MYVGIVLMCVDCVLAALRIAQADPGRRSPPRGGSITPNLSAMKSRDPKPNLEQRRNLLVD